MEKVKQFRMMFVCSSAVLILSSCHTKLLGMDRQKLFKQIDNNSKLTREEKQFAKRYHRYYWENLIGPAKPEKGQVVSLDSHILSEQSKSRWGLEDTSNLSTEEKVYIVNMGGMVEAWQHYKNIDTQNLKELENDFLKNLHLKYGKERVNYRKVLEKAQGKLTRQQELLLGLAEAVSGQQSMDDRALVFLYRMGGASVITQPKAGSAELPPASSRKIINVRPCREGGFLLTTWDTDDPHPGGTPFFYHSVRCDETGQILEVYRVYPTLKGFLPQMYGDVISQDCSIPQTWMWTTTKEPTLLDLLDKSGSWVDDRLYVGELSSQGLDSKMLLSTKGTRKRLRNWWYFDTKSSSTVFVVIAEYRFPKNKPQVQKIYDQLWGPYIYHQLRCYEYKKNELKLLNEVPIDDEEFKAVAFACGMDEDDFYLWVIDKPRFNPADGHVSRNPQHRLRVSKWANGHLLNWKECYKGGHLSNLNVNLQSASAARMSVKESPSSMDVSDLLFVARDDAVRRIILNQKGRFMTGSAYLKKTGNWAAVTWEGYRSGYNITFLDRNLNILDRKVLSELKEYGFILGHRLLYADGRLFLIVLTGKKKDTVFIQEIRHSAVGNSN